MVATKAFNSIVDSINFLPGLELDMPWDRTDMFSVLQQVFRTPLHDYNVLIHLHQRHLPLSEQGVDVTTATEGSPHKPHSHRKAHEKYSHLPVVEFNPVQQYLQELEVCHGNIPDQLTDYALNWLESAIMEAMMSVSIYYPSQHTRVLVSITHNGVRNWRAKHFPRSLFLTLTLVSILA